MNLSTLLKNKKISIVSPHFDDALLSCGSLIMKYNKLADITIINIFTQAHQGPYTMSARKFLRDSLDYSDATKLFDDRLKEDTKVWSRFKVKVLDLKLTDALFRKKENSLGILSRVFPELDHVYPTYRWHVVKKTSDNDKLAEFKNKLKKVLKNTDLIFAPYGIGNHADHLIVRKICEELGSNLVLYADFPYSKRSNYYGVADTGYQKFELRQNLKAKSRLLRIYASQFNGLFPSGEVPDHKEVFYIKTKI